jgi:hypothetical protein
MIDKEALRWFKQTFGQELAQAAAGTPFSVDLLVAIAAQETGEIWAPLRDKLSVSELLRICVGDTLDGSAGRSAFPQSRAQLVAQPRGEDMFRIAHDALVSMAAQVPGYARVARLPHKFCRGYGIFQSSSTTCVCRRRCPLPRRPRCFPHPPRDRRCCHRPRP